MKPPLRFLLPFQEFVRTEAFGGVLLLACTAAALAWANSPWADSYERLWGLPVALGIQKPLILWINDGLMAMFFFVVGLEIKREVLTGALASASRAALPIFAAAGGMIVPAAIYGAVNAGGPGSAGWGIPMATDIAFALGILVLIGKSLPPSLRVFLAIADDLGAVLVIAMFYTSDLSWIALAAGGGFLAGQIACNAAGVRHPLPYFVLGLGLWTAFLKSGVHPTVAGVLAATAIPARTKIDPNEFLRRGRERLDDFESSIESEERRGAAVHALEEDCARVRTPLRRLEEALHPWVAFGVMPLFALANAGVALSGFESANPVTLGVLSGLVLGKPAGVLLFSFAAVRLGFASLPEGVTWRHIAGVGCLAGIGFTMSLFIASLAFPGGEHTAHAKTGILAASAVAAALGWIVLRKGSGASKSSTHEEA